MAEDQKRNEEMWKHRFEKGGGSESEDEHDDHKKEVEMHYVPHTEHTATSHNSHHSDSEKHDHDGEAEHNKDEFLVLGLHTHHVLPGEEGDHPPHVPLNHFHAHDESFHNDTHSAPAYAHDVLPGGSGTVRKGGRGREGHETTLAAGAVSYRALSLSRPSAHW